MPLRLQDGPHCHTIASVSVDPPIPMVYRWFRLHTKRRNPWQSLDSCELVHWEIWGHLTRLSVSDIVSYNHGSKPSVNTSDFDPADGVYH